MAERLIVFDFRKTLRAYRLWTGLYSTRTRKPKKVLSLTRVHSEVTMGIKDFKTSL